MFHLRDALSSSEFGGRVDDVFAALGTGSVKQPDNKTQKISRLPTKFEDQQLARLKSLKPTKNDGEQKDKWEGESNTWVKGTATTNTGNNQGGSGQEDLRNKINKTKKDNGGEFKHPAEFLRPERRDNRFQPSRGGGRGRGRAVPDHMKNPDKWTKYSLADVDLVTDRGNTAAALDFLKDLRSKKEGDEPMDEGTADPNNKVVFKKPSRKPASAPSTAATTNDEQESSTEAITEKPTFVGSKQVMPEYVVGATRKAKKTVGKPPTAKSGKELKLSHLAHDEEEEDEQ